MYKSFLTLAFVFLLSFGAQSLASNGGVVSCQGFLDQREPTGVLILQDSPEAQSYKCASPGAYRLKPSAATTPYSGRRIFGAGRTAFVSCGAEICAEIKTFKPSVLDPLVRR
jgi:hypothetical protein